MTFLTRVWTDLATCKSPADYYRIQLAIQQYATPDEVAMIAKSSAALPLEFGRDLQRLLSRLTAVREEVHTCQFKEVAQNISLYSGTRPARRLVFAFCGKGIGMFMPTALVLQYLVPEGCEVVVLHDPARVGFTSGIFGYAGTFPDLVERLRKDIDLGAYESIGVYGISGGGAAALAAGVLLGAPSASSFSGHMPLASARYASRPGAAAMEALLREAAPLNTYACVFGASNIADSARGTAMATALKTRIVSVPGISNHNVIWELHLQGKLLPMFSDVAVI